MIDWLDTAIVVTLIGLLGSAIIAAVGYLFKIKREARRSGRRLLYVLLEIRHGLKATLLDPEKAIKEFNECFISYFKEKGFSDEMMPDLKVIEEMAVSHISSVLEANKSDFDERLLTIYENALSDLACEAPVLAFMLKGKDKLEEIALKSSDYLDSSSSSLKKYDHNEETELAISHIYDFANDEVKQKLMGMFNEELMLLARYCGRKELKQVKLIIENDNSIVDFCMEIEDKFEQLMLSVSELLKEQGQLKGS